MDDLRPVVEEIDWLTDDAAARDLRGQRPHRLQQASGPRRGAGGRSDRMIRTGAEYLEALRKPREVYVGGEKITQVLDYAPFRRPIESYASLYDLKHDPSAQEILTRRGEDGELHDISFRRAEERRGPAREGRSVPPLRAADVRLHGPRPRVHGGADRRTLRERRVVRRLPRGRRRERRQLLPLRPRQRPLPHACAREPAERPLEAVAPAEEPVPAPARQGGDRRTASSSAAPSSSRPPRR